jgi:hypothetical protein
MSDSYGTPHPLDNSGADLLPATSHGRVLMSLHRLDEQRARQVTRENGQSGRMAMVLG